MSDTIRTEYAPDSASPPGETLRETLETIGMSQAELASRTGRPRKVINEIVKGKAPITARTAIQLERALGIPARFWNNRERRYREALARIQEHQRLNAEVAWLEELPIAAMAKLGWIRRFRDKVEQVREALNFFGVASPQQWRARWLASDAAFRESRAFRSRPGAAAAWLRKGELVGQSVDCSPYTEERFREALEDIRGLTGETPDVFAPRVQDICARAGVAVGLVPELPGIRLSGATRWLSPDRALIQLNLRYKSNDQLWFTFYHEAGHILLHGKRDVFIDEGRSGDEKEREANNFAADTLIPPREYAAFGRAGAWSKDAIRRFAVRIGVAPGIVVGRLQHDRILPFTHCNGLKVFLRWASGPE